MAAAETSDTTPPSFECLKLRREVLAKEIDYRREKRWRIFSWTSSILLTALAGVIALTGKGFNFPMWPNRVLSAVAILSVTVYALIWISLNRWQEKSLEAAMTKYDDKLNLEGLESEYPFPLGYRMSILVTTAFAISVILFVGESSSSRMSIQPAAETARPSPSQELGR